MELKHIKSFLRVLDLGSFSRAARSLNIAQPALSQHVRILEDRLGIKLLKRSPRGVNATPAGQKFSIRARQIVELTNQTQREFSASSDTLYGEVKIGLPGSICPIFVPELIVTAKKKYPDIKLIVSELMSGDLAGLLREGRLDLAVLFNVSETDDYYAESLLSENLHLVGQLNDPLLQSGSIEAKQLTQLPIASTRSPHGLRLVLDRWANDAGINLNVVYEMDTPYGLLTMALEGHAYSILSHAPIRNYIEHNLLSSVAIENPPVQRKICLCESKRLMTDSPRQAIRDLMKTIMLNITENEAWQFDRITEKEF
ncbi:LysR family transcriptional regulator [Marinomonas sp. 15G1-11]|uniref:LysR family transcriptional regulator n=1 Tax=Marinomonas phaeophyticola TaxID=3004091 RepID=A0ABT4JWH6_9GAMM|nr:LysR family transcriptional regulator [Marinomonas sp. 15G1-11]MCZ2722653.1 LysR family transcriptional regulator [Marinomonas sp. 15G1-11]